MINIELMNEKEEIREDRRGRMKSGGEWPNGDGDWRVKETVAYNGSTDTRGGT